MPQIEGWATLHSPSAGAGPLVLTAPVIEALEQPLTRAKYYAEAEDEAGTLLWEFGVCSIRGTVIVKRDVINSSAGVGTAVEFPGTGVRLSVSEPVVAAVGPGGGGEGGLADDDYGAFTVSGGVASLDPDEVAEALGAEEIATAATKTALGIPASQGRTCQLGPLQFKGIANGDHELLMYAGFPFTITSAVVRGSEALTANVKNGSTSVTGLGAIAVTTSIASSPATAANTVAVGDRLIVTVTDIATTGDLTITLIGERNL